MPRITKEIVLKGYDYRIDIPAHEYGDEKFFTVACPSASDVSEARALRMRLSGVKGQLDPSKIDLSKALVAEEKARCFLIAKALTHGTGEEWSIEDVEKIKPPVLSRIWEQVDLLTGFSSGAEEEIKNFRRARKGKS